MVLACPKCAGRHDVDMPTSASGRALRFRCTECAHAFSVTADMFVTATPAFVAPTANVPLPTAPSVPPETTAAPQPRGDTIVSIVAGEDDWQVGSPALLHAWCLEGRVLPEDTGVTADGRQISLHSRSELLPFFEAARVLAAVREGRIALDHSAVDAPAPETPRPEPSPPTDMLDEAPAFTFAPPDDLAPLEPEPTALQEAPVPFLDVTVGFFGDDTFTDERAPLAALAPTEALDEDRPTTIGVVDEEALAAAAARARATPVPLAELLAGAVASLPREDTHEQDVPAPPPAMIRTPARTIVHGEVPAPASSPIDADLANSGEITVAVPEPAPFDDVWSAPPPQPVDLPWGKVAAGGIVLAVVAVFTMRGAEAPTPTGTASEPTAEAPVPPAEVPEGTDTPPAAPPPDENKPAVPTPEPAAASVPPTATPEAPKPAAPPPSATAPAPKPAPPVAAPSATPAPTATPSARPATTPRPRGPGATVKEGWSAVELGDFPRAKDLFSQAITLGGGSPAFHGRGYANERLGDLNAAVGDYCAALGASPSDPIRAELEASLRRAKRTCP